MEKLKRMWKSIYYLVYTEGYTILSIDEDNDEIWLTHEAKKQLNDLYIKHQLIKKWTLTLKKSQIILVI